MDTLFIADSLVPSFKFWHNGHIETGMHFRNELYGQVLVARHQDRQQFFQKMDAFSRHGAAMVITASSHQYKGWVNLRAPLAIALLNASNASDAFNTSGAAMASSTLEDASEETSGKSLALAA